MKSMGEAHGRLLSEVRKGGVCGGEEGYFCLRGRGSGRRVGWGVG